MTIAQVTYVGLTAAWLVWLSKSWVRNSATVLSPDVPYLSGFFVFQFVGYMRDSGVIDCGSNEDRYIWTTIAAAVLGTLALKAIPKTAIASAWTSFPASAVDGAAQARRIARCATLVAAAACAKLVWGNPFIPGDGLVANYEGVIPVLLAVPAAISAFLVYLASSPDQKRIPALLTVLAAAVAAIDFASRTPATYVLFIIPLLWISRHGKSITARGRLTALGVLPGVFLAFVVLAAVIKVIGVYVALDVDHDIRGDAAVHIASLSYSDVYENTCFIEDTFGRSVGYLPFVGVASVLLGPIPRSIWPDKPFGLARPLTAARMGDEGVEGGTSLSPGLVGELWMNGGWPAVCLGALLLGLFLWGLLSVLLALQRRGWPVAGAVAVLWIMTMLETRGDFYTITVRGGEYLVGTLLASRFVFGLARDRRAMLPVAASNGAAGTTA